MGFLLVSKILITVPTMSKTMQKKAGIDSRTHISKKIIFHPDSLEPEEVRKVWET